MKDKTKHLVSSNALRSMIQAEFGPRRFSDEEWWHIDRKLPPYCKADSVPWSEREPVFQKIVERLLFTHEATTTLPAARVIVAAAKHTLRPKLRTSAAVAQAPAGRPATAQEVSLIMRGWKAHGVEYAGELGQWMESGPHDYADLEASLPHQAPGEGDDVSSAITSMRWAG